MVRFGDARSRSGLLNDKLGGQSTLTPLHCANESMKRELPRFERGVLSRFAIQCTLVVVVAL